MNMRDLPEFRGRPRRCFSERLSRANMPHSMAVIDPGQFVILRLKGEYWEGEVVRRLNTDRELQWTFPEAPLRRSPLRKRECGMVQCGRSPDLLQADSDGISWTLGDVRCRPPLFNMDQLTKIHAIVLEGAMERQDFVTRAMEIREADIRGWVTEALQHPKMHASSRELIGQTQGDTTRTNRWLNAWVRRNQLRLRLPEPLECARTSFATRG
jgi:hypothetical protein